MERENRPTGRFSRWLERVEPTTLIRATSSVAALAAAVASLLALAVGARAAAADAESPQIVVYRQSVEDVGRATRAREQREDFASDLRFRNSVEGFAAELSERQVEELEADPEVAFVSPDRRVEAATVPLTSGDSAPKGTRRIEAATTTTAREASSAKVAVLDTGIDLSHRDLNAANGRNCISPGAPARDDNGHGTHVAGTIAARNDGAGVVGVAPGTKVYAVKVLDQGARGLWSQIICGIDWAAGTRTDADPSNDIAVANMSLSGSGGAPQSCAATTDALHKAVCRATDAGVTFVAAAGNSGRGFDSTIAVPAAYPEVLTATAASDSDGLPGASGGAPSCRRGEADDRRASFSNYATTAAGREHTIAAPGVCIRSTARGGGDRLMSGTSMAAPHVSGAAALCIAEGAAAGRCAGQRPGEIVQTVRAAARERSAGGDYGFAGDPDRPAAAGYFGYLTATTDGSPRHLLRSRLGKPRSSR